MKELAEENGLWDDHPLEVDAPNTTTSEDLNKHTKELEELANSDDDEFDDSMWEELNNTCDGSIKPKVDVCIYLFPRSCSTSGDGRIERRVG